MASVDDDFFGDQNSTTDDSQRDREWNALRRAHVKAGFREGKEAGHDAEMQTGFDSGFLAGAQATADAGFWLGAGAVVEAFYRPSRGKRGPPPGDSEVLQNDIAAVKDSISQLESDVSKVAESDTAIDASKAREACEKIIVIQEDDCSPVRNAEEVDGNGTASR